MRQKPFLLILCLLVGLPGQAEEAQTIKKFEGYEGKNLDSRFYREQVDSGRKMSVIRCGSYCVARQHCQAFYVDTTCHLIINSYRLHEALLLSGDSNRDIYLANNDPKDISCIIDNADIITDGTLHGLSVIITSTMDECIAKCNEEQRNNDNRKL